MKVKLAFGGDCLLKDVLYNLHKLAGDPNYGKGVLVGVVTTVMALGCTYQEAVEFVSRYLPAQLDSDAVPDCWKDSFRW